MKFSGIVSALLVSSVAALPATVEPVETQDALHEAVFAEPFNTAVSINEAAAVKRELSERAAGKIICFNDNALRGHKWRHEWNISELNRRSYNEVIKPRTCRRIACDGDIGVALCNDRNDLTWVVGPKLIAQYVVNIWNKCNHLGTVAAGQQFDSGGWNVIAQDMGCGARQEWPVGTSVPR